MTRYLQEAIATSTRATYTSAHRSFIHFAIMYHCLGPDSSLLPASEDTLMLFTTFLASTLKPQSIKVYLFGVRNLHLEHGFPDPLPDALQLRCLLRGIKRLKGASRDTRLPVTPSLLRRFHCLLHLAHYNHIMLWAAILVAFFGFLRSSELLALQHEDILRRSEGFHIIIKASKTDPFRHGVTVKLSFSGDSTLCAVTALDRLLAVSPSRQGLLFCFENKTPLTRRHLNTLIRELASCTGICSQQYSSHSFRIGAASTAAAAGIPDWNIQALGRWSSDCYQRYIHLPNTDDSEVAATLVRSRL